VQPAREAGDSIKPGVERQRNPRTRRSKKAKAREVGDSGNKLRIVDLQALSPASRAWEYCIVGGPWGSADAPPQALCYRPLRGLERFLVAGADAPPQVFTHWRVIRWEPLPT